MFVLRSSWRNRPARSFIRSFTNISVHTRFPATLYRIQQGPQSNLVAPDPKGQRFPMDEVKISRDGTVKIGSSPKEPVLNGAQFMPNTHLMQELTRSAFDEYIDEHEECRPVIIRLLKGTEIPESLLLLQQHTIFSLQCSRARTLHELNQYLDEFYDAHGTIVSARDWFRENEFADATGDDDISRWMSQ